MRSMLQPIVERLPGEAVEGILMRASGVDAANEKEQDFPLNTPGARMPTIEAGTSVVTHINVFTVDPAKQQALVDSLVETVNEAKRVDGWISASIHRSFDGRQVVNYVQFESAAAAQEVTRHLFSRALIQRNVALGRVAPGEYEVAYVLERD
jgi:hypothetical protein